MEDILLSDIESLNLNTTTREGSSNNVPFKDIIDDSASESNDEFDEIMNRDVLKLDLTKMHREIPGSSPRLSSREIAQSPFYSEDEDFDGRPPGRRLAPLGQDNEAEDRELEEKASLAEKVKIMEEEQEELNSSLMALTSHYAKVQLRLQQVVSAPGESREELLKDLEEFAFRGIPNMRVPENAPPNKSCLDDEQEKAVEDQRRKQAEAIEQLKSQLEELESYAYLSGDSAPPSKLLLERQRLVMEQLRDRLNLNVEDIAKLSEEQLKASVDTAVGQIVNPLKMKSQLVGQLQTQITDLEMFIQFLQEESSVKIPLTHGCGCEKHEVSQKKGGARREEEKRERLKRLEDQQERITILKRAVQALQLVSEATSLGCGGSEKFKKNTLKQSKGNHYGDLRAKLEFALEKLLDVCCTTDARTLDDPLAGGKDEIPTDTEFLVRSPEVTAIVRKELAVAIRDLMHHGLGQQSVASSIMPFSGCMSARAGKTQTGILHAWDVVVKFYEMKGGAEFNSAPARRLSRSFGLDLAGTTSSNKQALLQTVGQILASHTLYKRSPDAHFKALICAGLNKRKLVPWLRLILRNQTVTETMYQPWSYTVSTGFDDSFKLLERLSMYVFDLPVNIAVRQFQDMDEAF
eukprot:GFUD01082319.1.p1 GENE.GFUD01082319.1~~GFUD01082319.1.p1  ORF type:complete len:634 (-),score=187.67 GFUD01082319.1:90-1991(-)